MDTIKELKFLEELEKQEKYAGLVKTISRKGSPFCQVLGDAENLASEELSFEIIDGVKMFRLEEVNRFFTGFKINEFIVGFDDGRDFRKP